MSRRWFNTLFVLAIFAIIIAFAICESKHTEAFRPIENKIEVVGFFPGPDEIIVVKREEFIVSSSAGNGVIGTEWNTWKERYIPYIEAVVDTTGSENDTTYVAKIKLEGIVQGRYTPAKSSKEQYRFPPPEKVVVDTTQNG